jgi:hypothetical protein
LSKFYHHFSTLHLPMRSWDYSNVQEPLTIADGAIKTASRAPKTALSSQSCPFLSIREGLLVHVIFASVSVPWGAVEVHKWSRAVAGLQAAFRGLFPVSLLVVRNHLSAQPTSTSAGPYFVHADRLLRLLFHFDRESFLHIAL